MSFRLLLHSVLLSVALAARCYYTDGSYALEEQQPCFPDQENSACCGLAKTNGDENDYCLTNGLCLGQVAGYRGFMLLNSCTDSSWESDSCPNFCPRSMRVSYGIHILPCPAKGGSQWCCSTDGSNCCDESFELDMGTLMYAGSGGNWTNPTSVVNPPTSTGTSSTDEETGTTTVTVTTEPNPGSGSDSASASDGTCDSATCASNKTTVVGVGVGLGVALAVCLASSAAALYFQRRVFRKRLEETRSSFLASGYLPAPRSALVELPASRVVAELPASKTRSVVEMGEHL
ncbi:hypothetical protein BDW62DRAFT_63826 [Aspergillus aurantiobrunneus]